MLVLNNRSVCKYLLYRISFLLGFLPISGVDFSLCKICLEVLRRWGTEILEIEKILTTKWIVHLISLVHTPYIKHKVTQKFPVFRYFKNYYTIYWLVHATPQENKLG